MANRKVNNNYKKVRNAPKLKRSRIRNEKKMAADRAVQKAENSMQVVVESAAAETPDVPKVITDYRRRIDRRAKRTNPTANTAVSAKKARLLLKKGHSAAKAKQAAQGTETAAAAMEL
eukprot:Opistho-2@73569